MCDIATLSSFIIFCINQCALLLSIAEAAAPAEVPAEAAPAEAAPAEAAPAAEEAPAS